MTRTLAILTFAVLLIGAAMPAAAAEIQPLMAGWEQHFTVDWQPVQYRGKPALQGYVNNVSPHHTANIRVLVESLDASGQVTNQKVAWLPGDLLGGGRLYFQVPTPVASAYRVRVFSYDRVEHDGTFR
jgi:hypothetical protein